MESNRIWIAAVWLSASVFLLLIALHLAFAGRSFSLRATVRRGVPRRPAALGIETALAIIACLSFGLVLFSITQEQSLLLRASFGAAGAIMLTATGWWLFSTLQETAEILSEEDRAWRTLAIQVGTRLRELVDEKAIRNEFCQLVSGPLDAPQASVFSINESRQWTCAASTLPPRIGTPPSFGDLNLSDLDPLHPHVSAKLPGLVLLPVPVTPSRTEWLAVSLPAGDEPGAGVQTFLTLAALHAGAALNSAAAARAYAASRASAIASDRDRELWRRALARLVPPDLPDIAGLDYGAEYWRGQSPQGQFLDLVALPKGALGIVLAEVDSAGMEAAVQIAQLQVLLRSRFHAYADDLAELLQSTERALLASSEKPYPVRLFCARYSPETRTLAYVNAGAVAPLMLHRAPDGAQILRLPESSAAMAVEPPTAFRIAETVLQPGNLLAIPSLSLLTKLAGASDLPPSDSRLADSLISWEDRRASDLVRLVFRTFEENTSPGAPDRALILLKSV